MITAVSNTMTDAGRMNSRNMLLTSDTDASAEQQVA